MKKKICVLILIVLLIISTSPTVAFAAVHPLGYYDMYRTYNLDANNVKTGDTITINSMATKVVIQGNPNKTYTNVSIVCENAGGVDFVIEDLNLNTSTAGYECIKIKGPNNHIELRGSSHLTAGYNMPAIMVETGASLTITGYGSLTARGGEYGAAIGGRIQTGCGTVNIQGGNVTAIGGKGASGIGGGGGRIGFPEWGIDPVHGGNGGTVNISNNAVVYARGDWDDIGRGVEGYNSGSLSISGNAAVFFGWNGSDNKPAYINHSWAHHYIKGNYTFGYSLGGTPSSSITTRNLYTLTYDGNGGSGGGSIQYGQNESIALSDGSLLSKDGYTLMGWGDAPDNVKDYELSAAFVMPAANKTLYAAWSPFDITYHLDGGTNNSSNPSYYVTGDTPITLQSPTKSGHVFLAWYDGADSSSANAVTEIPSGSEGNRAYWAKWNAIPVRNISMPTTDAATVTVNTPYALDLATIFEDADGDSLTYTVSVDGAPSITADENYAYTPTSAGETVMVFTANDGTVDSTDTYTVTLTANTIPNRKESVPEADAATVTVNTLYSLDLSTIFGDADGDSLTYTVSIDGAPCITADENYTYTPTSAGKTVMIFTANDCVIDSEDTYTITLTANTIPNRKASVPEAAMETVTVNTPYTLDLSSIFEDADGDSLTYAVSVDGALGITADENYTYTPTSAGETLLVFTANDGVVDSTDIYTVTLTANTIPNRKTSVPEAAMETVTVNTPYTLYLSSIFEDADGDSLTYAVSVDGALCITANEQYSYIPTSVGDTSLTFTANDSRVDSVDTYTVTLTAKPAPGPTPTPIVTPMPTATPTVVPTPTPRETSLPSPTPALTTEPTTTATPQPSGTEKTIMPTVIEEDKETGTITVEINIETLPEGTEAIQAPNGDIINIEDAAGTLRLEMSKEDLSEDGSIKLITLDDEGTPLSSYRIQIVDEDGHIMAASENGWTGVLSTLLWILIGIAAAGVFVAVVLILLKKKQA